VGVGGSVPCEGVNCGFGSVVLVGGVARFGVFVRRGLMLVGREA